MSDRHSQIDASSPLTMLKGIGEKSAQKFASVGIHTVGDLIDYFPRAYEAYEACVFPEDLTEGKICAVEGVLAGVPTVTYAGRFKIVNARLQCQGMTVPVTWFNMTYLRSSLQSGRKYVFRGLVKEKGRALILSQPQIFSPEEYDALSGRLLPVYPLTEGLTGNAVSKAVRQAMDALDEEDDFLPDEFRETYHLQSRGAAIRQIHTPDDDESLKAARRRLVFDEFLLFIIGVRQMKQIRETLFHSYRISRGTWADQLIRQLPYRLTGAQTRVWRQIEEGLTGQAVMARLIQGDVGSGKTILALLAMLTVAESGGQSALMVPTGVLARQHFEAWEALRTAYNLPCRAVLLTGAMKAKERRTAYEQIASGQAQLIIGTHALFQEKVIYNRLMLVVTDEQHRFGVRQREALGYKGELPHTLVMSATPIPRTLAVILYGDLDVSLVDEMPANRLPIKTTVVDTSYRPKAYRFITNQINAGRQAYVICPLVEASDAEGMEELENVVDYTEKLRQQLPQDICVEMLHGRMKQEMKDELMERFLSGEIKVLVSTTVIEVGVNVPNASVMMIEDAQRFGLAQLHQLRGRVGRGSEQSYCILVYPARSSSANADRGSADASFGAQRPPQRLMVLKESNDGFEIARKDLEMRGPGDLFGVRQSGELIFRIADVFNDAPVMESAAEAASVILQEDPALNTQKYSNLRAKLRTSTNDSANNLNI